MRLFAWITAVLMGIVLLVHAQETAPKRPVYRLEFDVRSLGIAVTPDSYYSMLIDETQKAAFQTGNRVPIRGGKPQYVDVGVNIESAVHSSNGKIALDGFIELTVVTSMRCHGPCEPIFGQRKIAFSTLLDPGVPAVLAENTGGTSPQHVEAVISKVE